MWFRFILTCFVLVYGASCHQDHSKARDVECKFFEDDRGYVCEITRLNMHTEDDLVRFTGKQLVGHTNEDVRVLHIHSTESFIVPSENIFHYFVNLEILEMRGVKVKKVDPIQFCEALEKIILSENEIKKLSAGTFVECSNLEILDVSKNVIKSMSDNAFSSLKLLKELDLSQNSIEKLTRKVLKPMKKLRKLSLQNNKLKEIPQDIFNDLFDLQELDISYNPLTRIDFRVFDFIINIETLRLKGTEIKKFHPLTFTHVRRLKYLDISNNDLKNIENDMLTTNKMIIELRMDNCNLESMGRQFFDKFEKLSYFSANRNVCVDGVFKGDVVAIRPKFLRCFERWDLVGDKGHKFEHIGDEL